MRPAPERLAQFVHKCPSVEAVAALKLKLRLRRLPASQLQPIHLNRPRLALHLDALSRQFIKAFPVVLHRAEHRRPLLILSTEALECILRGFARH